MIERFRKRKQRQVENNLSNAHKSSLKRLSKRNRLTQLFFPTHSRIKLHQSQSATSKQTASPLNAQVAKLNQRAVDVRTGIEHSISSLQTQRLQHLTALNEKTRDLERAAAAFEYSSSKHLKQELEKSKKLSQVFKLAIALCLTLFSFMMGYMIVQLIRDKQTQ